MAKYTSAMFQGTPVIVMGIQQLPIDTKKIIQDASAYIAGLQYERCKGCVFYSGEYYLIPQFIELSIADVFAHFSNETLTSARIKEIQNDYRCVYVKINEVAK